MRIETDPWWHNFHVNYSQTTEVRLPCEYSTLFQGPGITITVGKLLAKHKSGFESLTHEVQLRLSVEQARELSANLQVALREASSDDD